MRLILEDVSKHFGEVVVGAAVDGACFVGSAIVAVATIGAIEPKLKYFAIASGEIFDLLMIVLEIFRSAIIGGIAIPWREIHAEFQPVFLASCLEFAHYVAFSVLVGRIANAVFGEFGRP